MREPGADAVGPLAAVVELHEAKSRVLFGRTRRQGGSKSPTRENDHQRTQVQRHLCATPRLRGTQQLELHALGFGMVSEKGGPCIGGQLGWIVTAAIEKTAVGRMLGVVLAELEDVAVRVLEVNAA